MKPTTFPTTSGELSLDDVFDKLKYSSYVQHRKEGVSHEDCVKHLGMPDTYRKRFDAEVVKRSMSLAFFGEVDNDSEEEN